MCGASREHAQQAVAAQSGRAYTQAWFAFQGLVKEKKQPDVADLFQPGDRLGAIVGWHQLEHAARRRRQAGLARDGEFLLEAGVQDADGADTVRHTGDRQRAGERDDTPPALALLSGTGG